MNVKQLQTYKIYMNYLSFYLSFLFTKRMKLIEQRFEKKHLINVKSNIY